MKDPYFDIPAMSNSALKWFKKSPKHYQWYKENPQHTTEAMHLGHAVHALVLEPEKFDKMFSVLDTSKRPETDKTMASNKNKEWLLEFNLEASQNDKEVITQDQFICIERMRDAVMSNGFAKELISDQGNIFEHISQWEENEIKCKSKIDILNSGFMADLKSCQDASYESFVKTVWNYEYYRQAGMYLDGIRMTSDPFYFIAVEKSEPFGVSVHKCTPELIEYGVREYKELISQYKACLESGNFPGYEKDAIMDYFDLELPAWVNKIQL